MSLDGFVTTDEAREQLAQAAMKSGQVRMNPRLLRKVNTEHRNPSVAYRNFDWSATFEGYEPGESVGNGKTEQEAVDWLYAEEAHLIAHEHNKEAA